jgi:hypothetical protein
MNAIPLNTREALLNEITTAEILLGQSEAGSMRRILCRERYDYLVNLLNQHYPYDASLLVPCPIACPVATIVPTPSAPAPRKSYHPSRQSAPTAKIVLDALPVDEGIPYAAEIVDALPV